MEDNTLKHQNVLQFQKGLEEYIEVGLPNTKEGHEEIAKQTKEYIRKCGLFGEIEEQLLIACVKDSMGIKLSTKEQLVLGQLGANF